MPKAQAIQINWQFTGSAGIMQVEHTGISDELLEQVCRLSV